METGIGLGPGGTAKLSEYLRPGRPSSETEGERLWGGGITATPGKLSVVTIIRRDDSTGTELMENVVDRRLAMAPNLGRGM
jgi:hypothetical protein